MTSVMQVHDSGEHMDGNRGSQRAVRATGLAVADLLSAPSASPTEATHVKSTKRTSQSPIDDEPSLSPISSAATKVGQEATSTSDGVAAYQYTAMQQVTEHREKVEYRLTIREQPKHSRMCGVGEKADRRPIDPAPIIQLRVIMHDTGPPSDWGKQGSSDSKVEDEVWPLSPEKPNHPSSSGTVGAATKASVVSTTMSASGERTIRRGVPVQTNWGVGWEDKTWYLENPYYFMYAMLASAETDEELHLLQDGKTRYTTGSCVSCLYHLKDIDGSEQGFFVFPDLSIRVEGRYRLKLCLFETIGHEVHHCKSVYSTPFNVYTAKRFPGMEESTLLSRSFADQGLKVRVRRNPRARRGRLSGKRKDLLESDEESDERINGVEVPASHSRGLATATANSSIKRTKNNESSGQSWQSYKGYPGPPNTVLSSIGHSKPIDSVYRLQSTQSPRSPMRERRYTDSIVHPIGNSQTLQQRQTSDNTLRRGNQEGANRASIGTSARQYIPAPQLQTRVMYRDDFYRSDGYPGEEGYPRYPTHSGQSGGNMERMGVYEPWMSQQHEHFSQPLRYPPPPPHASSARVFSREAPYSRGHRISSGLPMDEYGHRHDNRTMLPPLHSALSPEHSPTTQGPIGLREGRSRPSSRGNASPDLNNSAAFPRRMPPLPVPNTRLPPGSLRRDDQRRH